MGSRRGRALAALWVGLLLVALVPARRAHAEGPVALIRDINPGTGDSYPGY